MTDGRHFENSFSSTSQPRIIRFRSNLVHRCKKIHSEDGHLTRESKFFKFKMADGCHIENRFLAISRRHIGQLMRYSKTRCRITCRYRSCDQNGNFHKLKMVDGRHVEINFSAFRHIRHSCNELRLSSLFQ